MKLGTGRLNKSNELIPFGPYTYAPSWRSTRTLFQTSSQTNRTEHHKTLIFHIEHHVTGPIHRGMAHPWVRDGGEGTQMWRTAYNTLNKQSRAAEKGYSSAYGLRGM